MVMLRSQARLFSHRASHCVTQAMKRGLDCETLECLQDEPVSEIIRVQESIMGVPRSVGDFFT